MATGYPQSGVNPGLALFLGFIPGVGAIYNGQYAKGLVHAVVFGVLISILNASKGGLEPVFGILLPVWIFYMAFEAYHTARKRLLGEPVDEYSSIINVGGHPSNAPVAGVVLVVLGIVLLLDTLNIFDFEYLARYWPVLLIAAGAYLLYSRFAGSHEKEADHGR
jgi:TM2 domain-containing membrane protein YozV